MLVGKDCRKIGFLGSLLLSLLMSGNTLASSIPVIKAGTVAFATLVSAVNSDQPEHEIIATIIDGKFKGATLHGKLFISSSDANQKQNTILQFASISLDKKGNKTKTIHAYGIDFDAARTAMITEADFAELQRNSIKMASSFLDTYSNAHKIKLGAGNDLGILFMSNVS